MKTTLARTMAALLVTGGLTASGATAYAADGDVVVTATNVAYQSDDCFSSRVTVTGLDPSQDYDVEVTAPNGAYEDSEYAYDDTDLTFSVLLCNGVDPVGKYSVSVNGARLSTFRVSRPGFTVKRSGKRGVKARLLLDGKGIANRKVHLEVKIDGYWETVWKDKTDEGGLVGVVCNKHHRCPERYRYNYRDFVFSPVFRLYTGPKNGRAVHGPEATDRTVLPVEKRLTPRP